MTSSGEWPAPTFNTYIESILKCGNGNALVQESNASLYTHQHTDVLVIIAQMKEDLEYMIQK